MHIVSLMFKFENINGEADEIDSLVSDEDVN